MQSLIISDEQHKALKVLSANTGLKINELVEKFLREGIEKFKDYKPKYKNET